MLISYYQVNESKSVEIPVELIGKSEILDLNGISDRDTLNGAFTSRPQFKFENYLLPEQVSINIDRDNWNEPHRIYIDAISDTLPESLSVSRYKLHQNLKTLTIII